MKLLQKSIIFLMLAGILSCSGEKNPRTITNFNYNWLFSLENTADASRSDFDDSTWEEVRLPHDWSILPGYTQENSAASTGFVKGGIGWYRKSFTLEASEKDKVIAIEFDGVYCKSEVWINGQKLGFRPNGYSSFSYDLTDYLHFDGSENVLAVKVDHSNYADSRWYTGSGIYRDVRLVITDKTHIPTWGVRIGTLDVSKENASVIINTEVVTGEASEVKINSIIINPEGLVVAENETSEIKNNKTEQAIEVKNPVLWGIDNPALYKLVTEVYADGALVDKVENPFGIRFFEFDSHKGFSLNGESMKLKGVNLHHDAGALGAVVPKVVWEMRVKQLKSIGVNAIRMSHNPHSPDLMEVCDEQGVLVMNEFFDEWHVAKGKNLVYIGDNKAGEDISHGYNEYFLEWAERDLKDLISRDYNHPSVIMWSIGNEIEWTFPYYSRAYSAINGTGGKEVVPSMDTAAINKLINKYTGGIDSCAIVANMLYNWVKEADTTRPVTCGSVRASICMATGYGDAVDVLGINYGAYQYDTLHAAFPDKKLVGSENWGSYDEWKAVEDRDFMAGIFTWTGFAYLGEAGPWPRKGLDLSFFDFAGFKTPRGHFFECLWRDNPKVYMVTTKASESEYSYSEAGGWEFDIDYYPPPFWDRLRLWEWYRNVQEHWNFAEGEDIIIQTYTNCEEAELFLNGSSLGKQKRVDFEEDNIIKWLVPFTKGELKVVGYNGGEAVREYMMHSTGEVAALQLKTRKKDMLADGYDLSYIELSMYDEAGNEIRDLATEVSFEVNGAGKLKAVDNGWEMNIQPHYTNTLKTHAGRAIAIIEAGETGGKIEVIAKCGDIESAPMILNVSK